MWRLTLDQVSLHITNSIHARLQSCFLCAAILTINDLAKVRRSTFQACSKWLDIGIELGLQQHDLDRIKHDFQSADDCYREMLSVWLRMITPAPTLESLITTLSQPYVNYAYLVPNVQKAFKMNDMPSDNSTTDCSSGAGED